MSWLQKIVTTFTSKPWEFHHIADSEGIISLEVAMQNSGNSSQHMKLDNETNKDFLKSIKNFHFRRSALSGGAILSLGLATTLTLFDISDLAFDKLNLVIPAWILFGAFVSVLAKVNGRGYTFELSRLAGKVEGASSTRELLALHEALQRIQPELYILRDDTGFWQMEKSAWFKTNSLLYLFGDRKLRAEVSQKTTSDHQKVYVKDKQWTSLIELLNQNIRYPSAVKPGFNSLKKRPDRFSAHFKAIVTSDELLDLYLSKRDIWFNLETHPEFKKTLGKKQLPYDRLISYIADNRSKFREVFQNPKASRSDKTRVAKEIEEALQAELKSSSTKINQIISGDHAYCSNWLKGLKFIPVEALPKKD